MSAQGAIFERRAMHLPMIWPVVALLVVAVAVGIGVRLLDDVRPAQPITSIQETEGYWDPTVGHPVGPRRGAVAPVLNVTAIESSAAAVRELPGGPFHATGRAHEVIIGAEASGITFATGLGNTSVAEPGFGDCVHCQQRR
jgi:hypothetical protein